MIPTCSHLISRLKYKNGRPRCFLRFPDPTPWRLAGMRPAARWNTFNSSTDTNTSFYAPTLRRTVNSHVHASTPVSAESSTPLSRSYAPIYLAIFTSEAWRVFSTTSLWIVPRRYTVLLGDRLSPWMVITHPSVLFFFKSIHILYIVCLHSHALNYFSLPDSIFLSFLDLFFF